MDKQATTGERTKELIDQRLAQPVTDRDVIRAMELHGGAFASHLAIAATYADDAILARIKQAFPELWDIYQADAERMQAQQVAA